MTGRRKRRRSREDAGYWDEVGADGGIESPRANPDLLPEGAGLWDVGEMSSELEAIIEVLNEGGLDHLTQRERDAFVRNVVRGEPLAAVASALGIGLSSAQGYVSRAAEKLAALCRKKLGLG